MVKATIVVGLVMAACGGMVGAQTHAGARRTATARVVEPTGPTVVIDTSMGRITCRLYEKQAPVTVADRKSVV